MAEPQTAYARRSARVLLLDGADRLLLFEARLDPRREELCWFTPGGGVEDGESLVDTAVRELAEEIGLDVTATALGAPIAYAFGPVDLPWATGIFRDEFFALRVDEHEVDVSGFQVEEREFIVGHRWWPLDDLRTTEETIYPFGLTGLVETLLDGIRPDPPVHLPWHHDETG
jgi:8-oxo-dGTP pyrophosphatase MutT (NUDIX family)